MNLDLYYRLKPLIPRRLQIALRRALVHSRLRKHAAVWPIDEKTAAPPPGWRGWPDGKRFAFVITHDTETEIGLDRCMEIMEVDRGFGFVSSFNFVPERYEVPGKLRDELTNRGFEVGVHDLRHDGTLFRSRADFTEGARSINRYLREWDAAGFRSGSMLRNMEWIHDLEIRYDSSTFDTDPFEPHPESAGTIFPFWVPSRNGSKGYIELPYTLPQDFTLFILLRQRNIDTWKRKLDWIASKGGMALMLVHPDYVNPKNGTGRTEEYPLSLYSDFLAYVRTAYAGEYYHVLPRELAAYWRTDHVLR